MPSRRSILAAAITVTGAGCSISGESEIDPADHVPDDWHEEPERALGEPVTMDVRKVSEHPQNKCPYLAAETVPEVLEQRLEDPENVVGGGCCRGVNGYDRATFVERHVRLSRDGDVISSPNIEFRAVREAAPRTVKAPENSDHTCRLPVYFVDILLQAD